MKPSQHTAAVELARGASVHNAAAAAGVSVRSLQRWQADLPEFGDRVEELRTAMFGQAAGVLAEAVAGAAKRLVEITRERGVSPATQSNAARAILELATRYRADEALEGRIRALELHAGLKSGSTWE